MVRFWPAVVTAGYVLLAVVVGIGAGARGLVILAFLYLWVVAWVAFFLAWGWAAREAGRRSFRRVAGPR